MAEYRTVEGEPGAVNVLKSGKFRFIKNVKGAAKPKAKKAAKPRGKARRTSPGRRKTMARRKQSLPSRLINFALFMLAFSRPISLLIRSPSQGSIDTILNEASFGLAKGKLDLAAGGRMYAPVLGAFFLFEVKKMARQKFRF